MKQLVENLKTGELKLKDVPYPLCKEKGLVVRAVNSVISVGTEKSIIDLARKSLLGKARARPDLFKRAVEKARKEGYVKVFRESMNRLDEPFPLGYSASGVVVELGRGVRQFKVGDAVAVAGSGYANHAEYNFVPTNLCMKIPATKEGELIGFEEAAFCMLGGIAIQGIREAELTFGERVAVIGLGLLGLLTAQILRAVGCDVVCCDIDQKKCHLAKELGVGEVYNDAGALNSKYEDAVDAVLITAATKDDGPLRSAQQIARQRGTVVLVGVCDISLERKYFWEKELRFRVSKAAGPGILDDNYEVRGIDYPIGYIRWPEKKNMEYFLGLVAQKKVNVTSLITHRFPFGEAVSAYKMLLEGEEPYVSVLLDYPRGPLPGQADLKRLRVVARAASGARAESKDGRRNVGLIGGGLFAKNTLLPAIAKLDDLNLRGVATARGIAAEHIASKFGFRYATSDYGELLEDEDIGSVLIATRHNLHSKMVVEALKARKRVFVEKPLCLNKQELKEIVEAYEDNCSSLMVGFNRRYSPHALDMKKFFGQSRAPLVINCRINAGFIEDEHWTQDIEIGGGRLIGEVCHFVDFMQFVTGARPVKVYTESMRSTGKYRTDDNMVAILSFADGSLGTITYTSQGSKSYPREIIEVFQGGSVYYLEDFRRATKVKDGRRKSLRLPGQSMGYKEELEYFLSDDLASTTAEESFVNSLTVFAMVDSLRQGKAVAVGQAL